VRHVSACFAVAVVALIVGAGDTLHPILLIEHAEAAQRLPAGLPASAALLLRYDADHDNVVTREEMEAGLKADFAAADTNGDGCLEPEEVRAENQRRLTRDGAEASPLVDWNLDGCVDEREFGNTVRSYFALLDKTKNGRITQNELRGPSMPIAPRTEPAKKSGMDSSGSTTQTPTNPATGLPY
jgi:Ca2+-binding EF-hand superfamily protein